MEEINFLSSNKPLKRKNSVHQKYDAQELGISSDIASYKNNDQYSKSNMKIGQTKKSRKWKYFIGIGGFLLVATFAWFIAGVVGSGLKILNKNYTGGSPFLNFFGKPNPTQLKGEGDGRINILLLGMGGPGHDGPELTDTIMVLSIDPVNSEAAMLSIPRDLYVKIPDYGYSKINFAYAMGEQDKRAAQNSSKKKKKQSSTETTYKDGPTLAKETVSDILDLPIHYCVSLDFDGFVKLVNEVGGIDVYIENDLVDRRYPTSKFGYTTFKISKGQQHLNGETALKYARSRESTSDFDRAKRQQLVIQALKEKAISMQMLSNPVKIWDFSKILGDHVRMDFTLEEIKRLSEIVQKVPKDKVVTTVLDSSAEGPLINDNINGMFILRPKDKSFKEIQRIAHEIFTDPYLRQEKASIAIQNASGKSGMANKVAQTLRSYNYNIIEISSAKQKSDSTYIVDYTGGKKPFTMEFLKKRLRGEVKSSISTQSKADILIVLGKDYQE